ncbi:pyridoxine/pyridoxamine 5'-phosphate oxidase [Microlunatus sp. Y2014]|uniref:pyridoxine/pyridoxamine 5'-phosphate oxidase n=1 Tax=Microlunatus sp. Y2014 TaxID=3418488 RepID=UPI003DA76B4E
MGHDVRSRLAAIGTLTGSPPPLDLDQLPAEPTPMFLHWLDVAIAAGVPEPRAMTLSTVDAEGIPDARVLILKDVGAEGWAFAGTTASAKGDQLATNPAAALSFWWQPVMRAVRVRGPVVEASTAECETDLQARPAAARALVAPGTWRVWRVRPQRVEFWQGSPDRRHVRIVHRLGASGWSHEVDVEG